MKIDLEVFLATGTLPNVMRGSSRAAIVAVFGAPEFETPQRKSYPAMLNYGALEFRLRNDQLCVVALSLEGPHELPRRIVLESGFSLHRDKVEAVLSRHDIGWKIDAVMSDQDAHVLVTSNRLHLAFRGKRLTKVVADFVR